MMFPTIMSMITTSQTVMMKGSMLIITLQIPVVRVTKEKISLKIMIRLMSSLNMIKKTSKVLTIFNKISLALKIKT